MWNRNKFLPILLFIGILHAQSISTTDTVSVTKNQKEIQLKPYIVKSSLYVFHNGTLFTGYDIDHINGLLQLFSPFSADQVLHISYTYLEYALPIVVGPLYLSLPKIDSLLIDRKILCILIPIQKGEPKYGHFNSQWLVGRRNRQSAVSGRRDDRG